MYIYILKYFTVIVRLSIKSKKHVLFIINNWKHKILNLTLKLNCYTSLLDFLEFFTDQLAAGLWHLADSN